MSGLVVTLEAGARRQTVVEQLSRDSRITLGQAVDSCLPIVTDTQSPAEARDLCQAIERMDGVQFVAVISVDLSASEQDD